MIESEEGRVKGGEYTDKRRGRRWRYWGRNLELTGMWSRNASALFLSFFHGRHGRSRGGLKPYLVAGKLNLDPRGSMRREAES